MKPQRIGRFGSLALCLTVVAPAATRAFPIAFTQSPVDARPLDADGHRLSVVAGDFWQGMRVVTDDSSSVGKSLRVVSQGFYCASDSAYDHTGEQLLFSGARKAKDRLQIWQATSRAPEPAAVVTTDADCVRPRFLADGRIAFSSNQSREFEEHGGALAFSLFAAGIDRQSITRLTFNPSSDFDPLVLPDGRILHSSWQHVGNHYWPGGIVALLLINSDGTGLFPLTGNHRLPRMKRRAVFAPPDRVLFVQADGQGAYDSGSLVATSLNDPFAPYETIVSASEFQVHSAAMLPDGRAVVSARPTNDEDATFALYTLSGRAMTLLYDDPRYDELQPAVGAPVERPERRISTVTPGATFGHLTILNCFETDRDTSGPLNNNTVAAVRIIEGKPLREIGTQQPPFVTVAGREDEPMIHPAGATGYIPSRVLGEIPPASDGSVYMKVPADRPLRIQLMDKDGFAIVNERAWFWVRPGERRVCIGCHENRELSAHNVAPLATKRTPTDLTEPGNWRTVTFAQDIRPILTTTCAIEGCHFPPNPTAGLNMSGRLQDDARDAVLADRYYPGYANLLARQKNKPFSVGGRRVHPGDARSSPLLWMLYGRPLNPQYTPAPFDRPMAEAHPGPMLPAVQLELIRTWIDLGATYDNGTAYLQWPDEPEHARANTAEDPDGTH